MRDQKYEVRITGDRLFLLALSNVATLIKGSTTMISNDSRVKINAEEQVPGKRLEGWIGPRKSETARVKRTKAKILRFFDKLYLSRRWKAVRGDENQKNAAAAVR